jgi:pyridoxal phosphate enzyme (YggS family)
MPTDLSQTLAELNRAIAAATARAGRPPGAVTLVGVVKTQPEARVREAVFAGVAVLGENRVQEAQARWAALADVRGQVELRMIGPLQSNKADDAVALFDVIETLDRPSLAAALAKAMRAQGRRPRLLVQVNTGEEPQKTGVAPQDLADFLARIRDAHGLAPVGLMCIPPAEEPPGPHFALLAKLARRHGLSELSMGMSGDFETAIAFGATHVRIGGALFGARADHAAISTPSPT